MSKPPDTHTAYVLKRETRTRWRWIEVGNAQIHADGLTGSHHIHLDRLPVGGFSGHIALHPRGQRPPAPASEPERPAEDE